MPDNLYRRPNKAGGTWYARGYLSGKEVRESLQTSDLRIAKRRRDKFLADLETKREAIRSRKSHWSWKEAVGRWLIEFAPENLKPSTIDRYLSSFKALHEIMSDRKLVDFDRKLLSTIASRPGVTNATRRRDLTAVSSVLNAAEAWGWIDAVPAYNRRLIKERREPIVLPLGEEVQLFLEECHIHRYEGRAGTLGYLAEALLHTGMRLEEAASLKRKNLDLRRGAVQLYNTKGNRARSVSLSEEATRTFTRTPAHLHSEYVFWTGEGERFPIPKNIFKQIRKRLGFAWKTHDLRHLYAVNYIRDGGNLYDLQQQLGHSSIKTTEDYLQYVTVQEAEHAKNATPHKNRHNGTGSSTVES